MEVICATLECGAFCFCSLEGKVFMSGSTWQWQEATQEEVRRIRVDYKRSNGVFESFTFFFRPEEAIVECGGERRILVRLGLISGKVVRKIHNDPSDIKEALLNHGGGELLLVFISCRRVQSFQARVLEIYHD